MEHGFRLGQLALVPKREGQVAAENRHLPMLVSQRSPHQCQRFTLNGFYPVQFAFVAEHSPQIVKGAGLTLARPFAD